MSVVIDGRWMMFVDGENLAIRGAAMAQRLGIVLTNDRFHMPGTFLWLPRSSGYPFDPGLHLRAYYYTSVVGDDQRLLDVKDRLRVIGFDPQVFKKRSGHEKSKGVDIALTKDMLSHAFRGNYDRAVLVAGDGDYVPLVEEVKRLGKRVDVLFFDSEPDGLNPDLRRAADHFVSLNEAFQISWSA